MNRDDFVNHGLLVDLNRHWAHPRGFDILTTAMQGSTDGTLLLKLVPYITAPGGVMGIEQDNKGAAPLLQRAAQWVERRRERRIREMGAYYEPVRGYADPLVALHAPLVAPEGEPSFDERVGALAGTLAADALHNLSIAEGDDAKLPDQLKEWFAEAIVNKVTQGIAHVLARLRVTDSGGFHLSPSPLDTSLADRADGLRGRLRFLINEIPRLQEAYGSLLPYEVNEAQSIGVEMSAKLLRLHDDELFADERVGKAMLRLEELHDLAQPGMRFFRAEADSYHKDIGRLRDWAKQTIQSIIAARSDAENLANGDITPDVVRDKAACVAIIDSQIAALQRTRDDLNQGLVENDQALARLRATKEALDLA